MPASPSPSHMAIIDPKRREAEQEALRREQDRAEEYSRRNDAGAVVSRHSDANEQQGPDWTHPPPAYEDVPQSSQGTVSNTNSNEVERHTESSTATYESEEEERSPIDDETMPLLLRRQDRYGRDRYQLLRSIGGVCFVFFIVALVSFILLEAFRPSQKDPKPHLPPSDEEDGEIVQDPTWSIPAILDPQLWPDPEIPTYESTSHFSLSANDDYIFLRSRGEVSGTVSLDWSDQLTADQWEDLNQGVSVDRVLVRVQSRFTHKFLRDSIRVNKMKVNDSCEGVAIYSGHLPDIRETSHISMYVTIFVPQAYQRSKDRLAKDGSSLLSALELSTDNMRNGVNFLDDDGNWNAKRSTTFGRFIVNQMNGGSIIAGTLRATQEISINSRNGDIRDIQSPVSTALEAPNIDIQTRNGPIWLTAIHASKHAQLQTGNGGINVSKRISSPLIDVRTSSGYIGGIYNPQGNLTIISKQGSVEANIDLTVRPLALESQQNTLPDVSGTKFLPRFVEIHNSIGYISVKYDHHPENVQLFSNVTSSSGSANIQHDPGFEGTFSYETKLGSLDVQKRHDQESKSENMPSIHLWRVKQFIVDRYNKGLTHKLLQGHTYWADHDWDQTKKPQFSRSNSEGRTVVGSLHVMYL